ncbi:MAG: ABC transporter ATP-binding protein [Alphaproteobacteria bacterium]|nr:ABC transporter ATP-binding protein [Alphaproteobacteria bacterium]
MAEGNVNTRPDATVADTEILLANLEHRYATDGQDVLALTGIDLAIRKGEFVVLLGPSGCGKTTMLRIMAGLIRPSSGVVRIGGRPLWNNNVRDDQAVKELGVVFQDANLFPWMTIEDNISLPLKLRNVPRPARHEKASRLAQLVGIGGFEKRWPRELSGGMRQRAAIARALSLDPGILLMDEPFGALDAMTRDNMNVELQRIWMATNCTIVLVTHSISEAVFLADRILLLSPRPGRMDTLLEVGFGRPRDLYVQGSAEFQTIVAELRKRLDAMH